MGSIDTNDEAYSKPLPTAFTPLDPEDFRKKAHTMVDFIADYYKNIEKYPVLSQVDPGYLRTRLPKAAPYLPESFETILKDIEKDIIPGMTNWLSPNFFAYFPASVSSAAFLGEMLCTGFNSVGFNWLASPAATELEMVVIDWLANMLKLPKSFMFSGTGGGVIHGTTSEAVMCTVVAARDRVLEKIGTENIGKLVVYGSDQTHSFFHKTCTLTGIFPCNVRIIPTTQESNFSMSPVDLRRQVEADVAEGLLPLFVCATLGTTSTTAVDPVSDIAEVASEFDMWVHVDAAYAGSACICPEFRQYLDGVEKVHSLSLSPQKWLLSYLDCCCLWVKEPDLMVKALSTDPEYLRNTKKNGSSSVVEFKDWQIATGRRFRALRLWLIMRSYGVVNLQTHIRSDIQMAKMFEGFLRSDPRFELVVPRTFALVCFRFKPFKDGYDESDLESLNRKLLDRVNSTGRAYMTHTKVGGVYMLRFAVGATLTEESHVRAAWALIKEVACVLLREIL
ncbi:OLC1v1025015C1 [Oldenlandia corymbosa var. corymbosa]|uniref:OLC1v1025015C1 n=1 Tax=Oldenlandia corymbosa var. corymbosa TaxID=529605 RepID=A0AAV1C735_OLDCO|nr:OLC1v1025015C1 [Oldenlandia corymbosa var. corymbosa]